MLYIQREKEGMDKGIKTYREHTNKKHIAVQVEHRAIPQT